MIDELKELMFKKHAEVDYQYLEDLTKLVSDEELLKLYADYPEVFSAMSSMSKDDILNDSDLMYAAMDILEYTIKHRHLSKEEFKTMSLDEIKDYISSLIETKDSRLYDIIKTLED